MKKKALIILSVLFVFVIMSIGVSYAWPCKNHCGVPEPKQTCAFATSEEVVVCGSWTQLRELPRRDIDL
jgi:hypothetical protein